MAEGSSIIENLYHIDRGYENFEQKISLLGGHIERFDSDKISQEDLEGAYNAGL